MSEARFKDLHGRARRRDITYLTDTNKIWHNSLSLKKTTRARLDRTRLSTSRRPRPFFVCSVLSPSSFNPSSPSSLLSPSSVRIRVSAFGFLSCHSFCVSLVCFTSVVCLCHCFFPSFFPASTVFRFAFLRCQMLYSLFRFDSPRSVSVSVSLSRLQGMRGVFLRVPP